MSVKLYYGMKAKCSLSELMNSLEKYKNISMFKLFNIEECKSLCRYRNTLLLFNEHCRLKESQLGECDTTIQIIPKAENLFYGYYFPQRLINDLSGKNDQELYEHLILNTIFEEYYYYDNVDPPDEFTWEQWKARGKEWDNVLKGCRFKDVGFSYFLMDFWTIERQLRSRGKE